MHPAIAVIQDSLAYARFPNPEMRKLLNTHLNAMGDDISDDYEQGTDVEDSTAAIVEAMNEIDSASEKLDEALSNVDEEDDEVEAEVNEP